MVWEQYPQLPHDIDSLQHFSDSEQHDLGHSEQEYLAIQKRLDTVNTELAALYGKGDHLVDSFSKTENYKKILDSTAGSLREEYLNELDRKIPVVLSERKLEDGTDGMYYADDSEQDAHVFISTKKENTTNITTSVHELTHKATLYSLSFSEKSMDALRQDAMDAIEANRDSLLIRYPNLDTFAVYLSDPAEIIARMNSTRFWLHKNDPSYDATKPFTKTDYDTLFNNFADLPYDVQQLMDVFSYEDDFITNMNTY